MDVSRDTIKAVAELWTCYLKQKITATDAETMLWLAGLTIDQAQPDQGSEFADSANGTSSGSSRTDANIAEIERECA